MSGHADPSHPEAQYVQPAGLGVVGRLANHSCGGGNMRFVRGIWDEQRGSEVARLRTTRRVAAGEPLTWAYGATTDCQAEAEAVTCLCEPCDARAADGKSRGRLYAPSAASVPQCGKCMACIAAVFGA